MSAIEQNKNENKYQNKEKEISKMLDLTGQAHLEKPFA